MEKIFSDPITVTVIAGCIMLLMIVFRLCFGGKIKFKNKNIDISTGDNDNLSEQLGVPITKVEKTKGLSVDTSLEFASKICDLKIEENSRLESAMDSILEQQQTYAKKALKKINDDFIDSYRTNQIKKGKQQTQNQQIFQILFDRDYCDLIDAVLHIIKMNHLAEKNDDEFQDFLQINASGEIASLKRRCCAYVEPVDVVEVEELFKIYSTKFFDCIESSLENAKTLSIAKTKQIEKIHKDYEEEKIELLTIYFPELSKEEILKKSERL